MADEDRNVDKGKGKEIETDRSSSDSEDSSAPASEDNPSPATASEDSSSSGGTTDSKTSDEDQSNKGTKRGHSSHCDGQSSKDATSPDVIVDIIGSDTSDDKDGGKAESLKMSTKGKLKRVSESEDFKPDRRKSKVANVEDDFDAAISSDIKGLMSALQLIKEKAQKDEDKKKNETVSSVSSEINSNLDELKSKLEKERQSFAKSLTKSSKECESLLKTEDHVDTASGDASAVEIPLAIVKHSEVVGNDDERYYILNRVGLRNNIVVYKAADLLKPKRQVYFWTLEDETDLEYSVNAHRNLLDFKYVIFNSTLHTIIPYMDRGSMRSLLNSRFVHGLTPNKVLFSLKQIVQGLHVVHTAGRVHGNLTSSHVMITNDGDLKLAYAGSIFELDCDCENQFNYLPISNVDNSREGDIWMLGIIALELSYGKIRVRDNAGLEKLIGRLATNPVIKNSRLLGNLVSRCLRTLPGSRPTVHQLMEMLQGIRDDIWPHNAVLVD